MALSTKCQTPEVIYHIDIHDKEININMILPTELNIDKEEAEILEANIHNMLEITLSKYFK